LDAIIIAIVFIAIIVMAIGMYVGLDLRKWSSWVYGIIGFLCGLTIGFIIGNLSGGLKLGALFAFGIIYGGAVMRWHKQRYQK
jgi:hypothetical protein